MRSARWCAGVHAAGRVISVMSAAKAVKAARAVNAAAAVADKRAVSAVPPVPMIWRLRLAVHGVRLSRLAYDFKAARLGPAPAAYRVAMAGGDLTGAENAPLNVRVNIRAASFVLRTFGLLEAEIRADADGAIQAIEPRRAAGEDAARESRMVRQVRHGDAVGSSAWSPVPSGAQA